MPATAVGAPSLNPAPPPAAQVGVAHEERDTETRQARRSLAQPSALLLLEPPETQSPAQPGEGADNATHGNDALLASNLDFILADAGRKLKRQRAEHQTVDHGTAAQQCAAGGQPATDHHRSGTEIPQTQPIIYTVELHHPSSKRSTHEVSPDTRLKDFLEPLGLDTARGKVTYDKLVHRIGDRRYDRGPDERFGSFVRSSAVSIFVTDRCRGGARSDNDSDAASQMSAATAPDPPQSTWTPDAADGGRTPDEDLLAYAHEPTPNPTPGRVSDEEGTPGGADSSAESEGQALSHGTIGSHAPPRRLRTKTPSHTGSIAGRSPERRSAACTRATRSQGASPGRRSVLTAATIDDLDEICQLADEAEAAAAQSTPTATDKKFVMPFTHHEPSGIRNLVFRASIRADALNETRKKQAVCKFMCCFHAKCGNACNNGDTHKIHMCGSCTARTVIEKYEADGSKAGTFEADEDHALWWTCPCGYRVNWRAANAFQLKSKHIRRHHPALVGHTALRRIAPRVDILDNTPTAETQEAEAARWTCIWCDRVIDAPATLSLRSATASARRRHWATCPKRPSSAPSVIDKDTRKLQVWKDFFKLPNQGGSDGTSKCNISTINAGAAVESRR